MTRCLLPNSDGRALKFVNVALLILLLLTASCEGSAPKIVLSREKIADRGAVEMTGTGFTPKSAILSHLKRPDGTESNPLRFITDEKGEFAHKINTLDLLLGKHQVWVVDSDGVISNIATFEVTQ
jgi:hypothetical protein